MTELRSSSRQDPERVAPWVLPLAGVVGAERAGVVGEDGGLDAIVAVELGQDSAHVGRHV